MRKLSSIFGSWARRAFEVESLGSEPPREAINAGLELMSKLMEPDHYVLHRRERALWRVGGDLTFIIRLQADRHNRTGERASVWMHLGIRSKRLSAWRRAHSSDWIRARDIREPGVVLDAQFGNVCLHGRWPRWDFARPSARPRVSLDAVTALRSCAYPLFESFGDVARCVPNLLKRPAIAKTPLLEYALSHGQQDLVAREMASLLTHRGPFSRHLRTKLNEIAVAGLAPPDDTLRDEARDLASLAIAAPIRVTGAP